MRTDVLENWSHMLAENHGMVFSTASSLNRYLLDHLIKLLLLTTRIEDCFYEGGELRFWSLSLL